MKSIHNLYLIAVVTIFFSNITLAETQTDIQRSAYQVFSGDVNGDGRVDLLFKATHKFLMLSLDDELTVPISLPPPTPTSILLSGSNGSYSLVNSPPTEMINSPVWRQGTHEVLYGNTLRNTSGMMIVKSLTGSSVSFSISASSGIPSSLSVLQTLDSATLGVSLTTAGLSYELADHNSDGRSDLVIKVDGIVNAALPAGTDGRFLKLDHTSAIDLTARVIFNNFMGLLEENKPSVALKYVMEEAQEKYQSAFQTIGTDLANIPKSVKTLTLIEANPDYARYVVDQAIDGRTTMHYITFLARENKWVLGEF